jgi:hypothetical protein
MNEDQQIKAWSMMIAATLYRPKPDEADKTIKELMEWLIPMANPIADELRKTPFGSIHRPMPNID